MVHRVKIKDKLGFHLDTLRREEYAPLGALEISLEDSRFAELSDKEIVKAVEKVFKGKIRNYRTPKIKFVKK